MTVEFFDSDEEMFARIEEGVLAAKARATPRQNAITYGDYWMRIWPEGQLLIFGYVTPMDELDAEERRLGATEEEIEEEHETLKYSYNNGFRFGRAYSAWEQEGELGDTHVSTMIPITKEEFEQAREAKWSREEIRNLPWFNPMLLLRIRND
jgi:hypothetical protein